MPKLGQKINKQLHRPITHHGKPLITKDGQALSASGTLKETKKAIKAEWQRVVDRGYGFSTDGKIISIKGVSDNQEVKEGLQALNTTQIETALASYEVKDQTSAEQPASEKYIEKPQATAHDKRTTTAIEYIKNNEILDAIDIAQQLRTEAKAKIDAMNSTQEFTAKATLAGEIRTLISDIKLIKKELATKLLAIAEEFVNEVEKDESKRPNAIAEINHVEQIHNDDFEGKLLDENDTTKLQNLKEKLTTIDPEIKNI